MYWTPCARLMKFITPNTSVRPAAIRNSSTPSCRPLRICTMKRAMNRVRSGMATRLRAACEGARTPGRAGLARRLMREARRLYPHAGTAWRPISLHRTVLGMRIGEVSEHLFVDFSLEFAIGAFGNFDQIEVLDRIIVRVEFEAAAQRGKVRFLQ